MHEALLNGMDRRGMLKRRDQTASREFAKAIASEDWRRYGWYRSTGRCPR